MVFYCYVDVYFSGLYGYKDPQDPICLRSRMVYVATFANGALLWVSKLQREMSLSNLCYKYVDLYQYLKNLLPFILTQFVINNIGTICDR